MDSVFLHSAVIPDSVVDPESAASCGSSNSPSALMGIRFTSVDIVLQHHKVPGLTYMYVFFYRTVT